MKKLLLSSVLAASSVLAVTGCTSVNATTDTTHTVTDKQMHQKGDMKRDGMKKGGMKGPMSKLDLTATQKAQIKAIMQEKRGDHHGDREQMKAEHDQMRQQLQALTNAETLNMAAVNRLADQQAAKVKQRFVERMQTQHEIAQVLTADQRAELAELQSERAAKGKQNSRQHKEHGKPRQHQGM
ncbi:Spy/CpxP family protein refolding chaperone [Psychrobacter sp.]|uniref:Spy/CpxP family protein refolding chaperone n=1 Tax=Psychrobacter sp. TaxID=56811 RepID=UPI00264A0000|nr:Spy/CpxP family protein refolding chaperone [Psychrobacter sp.]MDN6275646.1 Spy/CpxP family protein refolding chaperone [Psychrobacter sp.]MDN6307465.1 Spy/CpxP family protein refolding chaperone [Psychrobacter sp.]